MIDDFGYESPINIYFGEIQQQIENEIMKTVTGVGVHVDKEELLAALRYDRGQYEKGYQDGLNANKWIPVEERLPEEDGMYLITSDVLGSKEIQCVLYQNMILHDFISSGKAVAWMPLPAPYDMRKKVEE